MRVACTLPACIGRFYLFKVHSISISKIEGHINFILKICADTGHILLRSPFCSNRQIPMIKRTKGFLVFESGVKYITLIRILASCKANMFVPKKKCAVKISYAVTVSKDYWKRKFIELKPLSVGSQFVRSGGRVSVPYFLFISLPAPTKLGASTYVKMLFKR